MPALVGLSDVLSMEELKGVPGTRGNPFEVDDDIESSVSPSSIDWERFIDFRTTNQSRTGENHPMNPRTKRPLSRDPRRPYKHYQLSSNDNRCTLKEYKRQTGSGKGD